MSRVAIAAALLTCLIVFVVLFVDLGCSASTPC